MALQIRHAKSPHHFEPGYMLGGTTPAVDRHRSVRVWSSQRWRLEGLREAYHRLEALLETSKTTKRGGGRPGDRMRAVERCQRFNRKLSERDLARHLELNAAAQRRYAEADGRG